MLRELSLPLHVEELLVIHVVVVTSAMRVALRQSCVPLVITVPFLLNLTLAPLAFTVLMELSIKYCAVLALIVMDQA